MPRYASPANASENGFPSWSNMKRHIESRIEISSFDKAVQAIIGGDATTLRQLLRGEPQLIRARSASAHECTLLHYIAANGVENELQKSPPNAVEIAHILLEAGAEVDATSEMYGGGYTTMNGLVTSVWPYRAGVQEDLVEVLLDAGAAIDGLEEDGAPVRLALKFGYVEAARKLERRGCRIDRLDVAAGLGRVDLMEEMLTETTGSEALRSAWALACGNGHIEAARLLLEHGVDIDWQLEGGGTALHAAILQGEGGGAPSGRLDVVQFLIETGADQDIRHAKYNATGIDFASHNGRKDIVEYLLNHGATDVVDALKSACEQGWPEIARMLIQAGVEPPADLVDSVESRGDEEMLQILRGASL